MTTLLEAPPEQLQQACKVCEECAWAGACIPASDLLCLILSKPALEAEYGWDAFGFIAEAKRQHRKAKERGCLHLADVTQKAEELAPQVDFSKMES
jgi:hypothetical protein